MRRSFAASVIAIVLLAGVASFWALRGAGSDDLLVSPSELDFGSLMVGEKTEQVLIATNVGDEPLRVQGLAGIGPFTPSRPGFELAPGEAAEVVVSFEPSASGESAESLVLLSEAFSEGRLEVALRGVALEPPAVRVEPASLDFGSVGVGREARAELSIHNEGGTDLEIVGFGSARFYRVKPGTLSLAPGGQAEVGVIFAPEEAGGFEGNLALRSNDPNRRVLSVAVKGVAHETLPQPRIGVEPASLDFGNVSACSGPRQWVTVRNDGEDELAISRVRFPRGFLGSPRGLRLDPGAEFSFPVTFAPRSSGDREGKLVLFSNDPSDGAVEVALRGRGAACSEQMVSQIRERRIYRDGARESFTGGGASGGAGGGRGRGGFGDTGPDAGGRVGGAAGDGGSEVAGDPGSDPGDGGESGDDASDILAAGGAIEGAIRLGSYETEFSEMNVGAASFDPASGRLSIQGLDMPAVDAALGEFFQFDTLDISGRVDALGDVEIPTTITMYDAFGNEFQFPITLTTGESQAVVEGEVVSVQGERLVGNRGPVLVGIQRFDSGPFEGQAMRFKLHVRK